MKFAGHVRLLVIVHEPDVPMALLEAISPMRIILAAGASKICDLPSFTKVKIATSRADCRTGKVTALLPFGDRHTDA